MAIADSIQNYYEKLVIDQVHRYVRQQVTEADEDLMVDITCVALNRLPARYVRHAVDASFYLTTRQREEMEGRVNQAVADATEFVVRHRREEGQGRG